MGEEISGDWTGVDGALTLTGDKPTLKLDPGAIAGDKPWIMHVGSEGPGNLTFFRQGSDDDSWDLAMVLTSALQCGVGTHAPADGARVEIVGDWNDTEGALRVSGDKPTMKLAGGPITGNTNWLVHVGSNGPGDLAFFCQDGAPNRWKMVMGLSTNGTVVVPGNFRSDSNSAAVAAINESGGAGVYGKAGPAGGSGVHGESGTQFAAVVGFNTNNGPALWGVGGPHGGEGVHAETQSGSAAVAGYSRAGAGPAGFFDGNVVVTGDVILQGADYAEALTTDDPDVVPGAVVVVGDDGQVHPCERPYDTRVAGIVSGAGGVKPALVLDRHENSAHIAMMGKVWCQATAEHGEIRPGDLLTTSATHGHCARVQDPAQAFGAVIGKALTPLQGGHGLVHVLVGRH